MRKKVTVIVTFAAAALTVAAVAAAHPAAAKQQVEIDVRGPEGHSFVLTPLGRGALTGDRGTVSFCCWSQRNVTRDGEVVNINNPKMTLIGARGTIVTRDEMGGSTSRTAGRSSRAAGGSSAARAHTRGCPEVGSQPASSIRSRARERGTEEQSV